MSVEVRSEKLIASSGEVLHEVQPGRTSVQVGLHIEPLEGHPRLVMASMDLQVRARDVRDAEDVEEVDWAVISVRYAVELSDEPPSEFTDEGFAQIATQIWPYLRSQCLNLAAQLDIGIDIPFAAASVLSEAQRQQNEEN